jgi:hypothetical protein
METNNQVVEENKQKEEQKDTLKDEHWEEGSDEEEEVKTKVVSQPKKHYQKDKHGEIIISTMDVYVEPSKAVKEARGDQRMMNKYDFGDLSYSEEDEQEEENQTETVNEEEEEKKKKKTQSKSKKAVDNLDDLLKEFGIESKTEAPKAKESKPKKVKTEQPAAENTAETPSDANQGETKKKKKKATTATTGSTKRGQHVNELKREIIERKEALKKKEKKKGI